MSILSQLFTRPRTARREKLAVSLSDGFYEYPAGAGETRERYPADRQELLRQSLEAWQTNPLARRIVELTSQYVVGGGITLSSKHPAVNRFLHQWWNHPLNRMDVRCSEWCEELVRSGEIFVILSSDPAGMSYLRALPAVQVQHIHTAANDIEQETAFSEYPSAIAGGGTTWQAWQPSAAGSEELPFAPVVRHYAINRPVGALRGEPDLAPLLKWLARYSAWLEDRVRLNRYRQAFLYQVKAAFTNEQERHNRQTALNRAAPNPGSILVTDESETWSVIQPNLASTEAGEDGLAIKRIIAAGAGLPMHFLAEPEGATRTTAESAGGPTFRHFEQRQRWFLWMIRDLAGIVLARRAQIDRSLDPAAEISVQGTDISARDNGDLASAAEGIIRAFSSLRDRGLIDDAELLRLAYRFSGEVTDVEEMLRRGKDAQLK